MAGFDEGAHPRDENGRFTSGESDASQKSRDADNATARADRRDESLGSMSGVNPEHQAAADLHRDAAEAHERLAARYREAGDTDKAEEHEGQAADHRAMVDAHETGAGRTAAYQAKQKANAEAARQTRSEAGPGKPHDRARDRRIANERQNDERVAANVHAHDPALVPVWNKVKGLWSNKGKTGMSFEARTSAFMDWVHDHPKDVVAIQERHADKQLKSSLGQWASKTAGPGVAKTSKRDGGLGTWAKRASGAGEEVPF
jgi:hypothetical protein